MSDITLSSAVRTNLLSLQNTADLLGQTQSRLATGLKVNSALDDPTAFFTASSLNSRAGDLNRLLDSIGNAVQTIQAADNGIEAITDLVENAQATARQALQTPVNVSTGAAATITGTGATVAADAAAVATGSTAITAADEVVATGSGIGGDSVAFGDFLTARSLSDGDTFTIDDGTNTAVTFEFDSNATVTSGNVALNATNSATTSDLIGTINTALSGVTVANGGSSSAVQIELESAVLTDLTVSGDADVLAGLGLGAIGTGTSTSRTVEANNIQVAGLTSTLTVQVGSGSVQSLDLSSVNTKAELDTALGNLSGVTAQINGSNQVEITASNTSDSLTIGGSADSDLGITSADATNTTLGGLSGTLTIAIGTDSNTIQFGSGANDVNTFAELESALADIDGGTASVDSNGNLTVTATSDSDSITLGGTNLTTFGTTAGKVDSTVADGVNPARAALTTEFNDLLTQIDQLSNDASYNGNNLLSGDDLTVIFNEDGSSSLDITGVDFDAAGLGITSATSTAFDTNAGVNATLDELDSAVASLRSQASTFGSQLSVVEVRNDFTKNLVNTLETGAANLTLADLNEEGANAMALQTRQQLSSVALSLSVQADQSVLRLF